MGKGNRIVLLTLLATLLLVSTATAVPYSNAEPIAKIQKTNLKIEENLGKIEKELSLKNKFNCLFNKTLAVENINSEWSTLLKELDKDEFFNYKQSSIGMKQVLDLDENNTGLVKNLIQNVFILILIIVINVVSLKASCIVLQAIHAWSCSSEYNCLSLILFLILKIAPIFFMLVSIICLLSPFAIIPIFMGYISNISDPEERDNMFELMETFYLGMKILNLPGLILASFFLICYLGYNFMTTGRLWDYEESFGELVLNYFIAFNRAMLEMIGGKFYEKGFFNELRIILNELNNGVFS